MLAHMRDATAEPPSPGSPSWHPAAMRAAGTLAYLALYWLLSSVASAATATAVLTAATGWRAR